MNKQLMNRGPQSIVAQAEQLAQSLTTPSDSALTRHASPSRSLRFATRAASLSLAWLLLTAAWPQSAHYTPETDEMLWFLTIADSHIGQGILGSKQDSDNLKWAIGELYQTVQPSFLVNAGDLVDGTGGGAIPLGQFDQEWEEYHQIVTDAGMTADFYFDLPGNHDNYAEWPMTHYFGYSIQGAASSQLNHSWTRFDAKGNKYLFLGIATNGNDKSLWLDDPGLDAADVAFGQDAFASNTDADIAVVMGHHPVDNFKEGGEALIGWFLDHAVSAYVFGHSHDYSVTWDDGTLEVNIRSTAKNDDRQIGLVAFDGLGMSAKVFDVGAWPQVMITTPVDSQLGGNNPYDYMIPDSLSQAKIRAIAFHPDGVASVTALLDGSVELPMELIQDNVWQTVFDASQLGDDAAHTVKVTATASGNTNEHQVTFYVFHDETPPDPVDPGPESDDIAGTEPFPDSDGADIVEEIMVPVEQDFEVVSQDLDEELPSVEEIYVQDLPAGPDDIIDPDLAPIAADSLDEFAKDGPTTSSDVAGSAEVFDSAQSDINSPDTDSPGKGGKSGGCAAPARPDSSPISLILLLSPLLILSLVSRRRPASKIG